jgi:hypothetical protein
MLVKTILTFYGVALLQNWKHPKIVTHNLGQNMIVRIYLVRDKDIALNILIHV